MPIWKIFIKIKSSTELNEQHIACRQRLQVMCHNNLPRTDLLPDPNYHMFALSSPHWFRKSTLKLCTTIGVELAACLRLHTIRSVLFFQKSKGMSNTCSVHSWEQLARRLVGFSLYTNLSYARTYLKRDFFLFFRDVVKAWNITSVLRRHVAVFS